MSVYKMNNAQTIKFVELYRDAVCLWDTSCLQYKNRDARNKALAEISEEMNIEGFGPREVAQKVKNIRSSYYQELKKIEHCRKLGVPPNRIYRPKVPWFNIIDSVLKKVSRVHFPASDPETTEEMNVDVKQEPVETGSNDERSLQSERTEESDKEADTPEQPRRLYRKLRTATSVPLSYITDVVSKREKVSSAKETEFDIWAKSLAMQLNNMEVSRALQLQLKIQTLVAEERIAYECSRQTLSSPASETHHYTYSNQISVHGSSSASASSTQQTIFLPAAPGTPNSSAQEQINARYILPSVISSTNNHNVNSFSPAGSYEGD